MQQAASVTLARRLWVQQDASGIGGSAEVASQARIAAGRLRLAGRPGDHRRIDRLDADPLAGLDDLAPRVIEMVTRLVKLEYATDR